MVQRVSNTLDPNPVIIVPSLSSCIIDVLLLLEKWKFFLGTQQCHQDKNVAFNKK